MYILLIINYFKWQWIFYSNHRFDVFLVVSWLRKADGRIHFICDTNDNSAVTLTYQEIWLAQFNETASHMLNPLPQRDAFSSKQCRSWLDFTDGQTDLHLHWAHMWLNASRWGNWLTKTQIFLNFVIPTFTAKHIYRSLMQRNTS